MKTVSSMTLHVHDAHTHGAPATQEPPERQILDTAGDLLRALAAPVRIALVH